MAEYEAALAEARAGAQAMLAEAQAASTAEAERQSAEVADRLSHAGNEAAARIAASKAQALVEVRTVAAELAGDAVDRLIGLRVSAEETEGAVDQTLGGAD